MPEIGLDDEPISPVSRDETVTNRNPNSTIMAAADEAERREAQAERRGEAIAATSAEAAEHHDPHRQVVLGPRACRRRRRPLRGRRSGRAGRRTPTRRSPAAPGAC